MSSRFCVAKSCCPRRTRPEVSRSCTGRGACGSGCSRRRAARYGLPVLRRVLKQSFCAGNTAHNGIGTVLRGRKTIDNLTAPSSRWGRRRCGGCACIAMKPRARGTRVSLSAAGRGFIAYLGGSFAFLAPPLTGVRIRCRLCPRGRPRKRATGSLRRFWFWSSISLPDPGK